MRGLEWEQMFFIILMIALVLIVAALMLGSKIDFLSYFK